MDLDLLCAKKNYGRNRRAALKGLKRKKLYEKQLTYVDHAIETRRFACKNKEMMKVNDLIKGITLEADGPEDMSGKPYMSVNQEGEFKEDERLAELEGLKKSLNESLLEANRVEDRVHPSLASSASPSSPGIMEEDEVENDLEYLRRWANESLQAKHQTQLTKTKRME